MPRFPNILTRFWFFFSPFRVARQAGEEELLRDLRDLTAPPGEPQEPLADAEISEKERQEAVRRYQRELKEEGRR